MNFYNSMDCVYFLFFKYVIRLLSKLLSFLRHNLTVVVSQSITKSTPSIGRIIKVIKESLQLNTNYMHYKRWKGSSYLSQVCLILKFSREWTLHWILATISNALKNLKSYTCIWKLTKSWKVIIKNAFTIIKNPVSVSSWLPVIFKDTLNYLKTQVQHKKFHF